MKRMRLSHKKDSLTSGDILNYMKQCKEDNDSHLFIYLLTDNKYKDKYNNKRISEYKIIWPDINEIINNNYDNIQVFIECSHDEFCCNTFIIENYDDSYYKEDILNEFSDNMINRLFLKGFYESVIFKKCYAFNTTIQLDKEINNYFGITIHIDDSSYIDNIKIYSFNDIDYLLVKNGSSINTLELIECIIKYGMYYIEYNNKKENSKSKNDKDDNKDNEEESEEEIISRDYYYNNDKSINNNGMNNIIINRLRLNKSIIINNYDSLYDDDINNMHHINDSSVSIGIVNDNSSESYFNDNNGIDDNNDDINYYMIRYDLWNISKYNRICFNNNNIRYIDSIYSINKE